MFRWGFIVMGVLSIVGGMTMWMNFEKLQEDAQAVSIEQAIEHTAQSKPHYVSIEAQLDTSQRIYLSGLSKPYYASHPPYEVVALNEVRQGNDHAVESLLGSRVEVSGMLDPRVLVIELIREETDQQTDKKTQWVQNQRYIAPVISSQGLIFAVSPIYSPDSEAGEQWCKQSSFTGRLSRFDDLSRNVSGLGQQMQDIRQEYRLHGIEIPQESVVVLTGRQAQDVSKEDWVGLCYVPIVGSDNHLFVKLNGEQELGIDGLISGVLKPRTGSRLSGFSHVLQTQLPDRVGVISLQTAAAYNEEHQSFALGLVIHGLMFSGLGWWMIRRKRAKRQRALRECQEALAMTQGQAITQEDIEENPWRHAG